MVTTRPRWTRGRAWSLLVVLAIACARQRPSPGLGRRIVDTDARALRASNDGTQLAFLHSCRPIEGRIVPLGAAACDLGVVATAGGPVVRIAGGVTTLGHGFVWSRTGHVLAALADEDLARAHGALVVWAGGDPKPLATEVSFYGIDRGATRLGWVARGQLHVARVDGGEPAAIAGAEGISTFEFGAQSGLAMLARRSASNGGALLAVRGATARPVASEVRDYAFAADGEQFAFTAGVAQRLQLVSAGAFVPRGPPLGRDVQSFLFASRGRSVAFIADAAPGRQGDLWIAVAGSPPVLLARRVGEPRWTADGAHLAWLQDYDPRSRTGTVAVGGLAGRPQSFARNVSDFELTPDGSAIAYLVHETAGGYSVDLGLAPVGRPGAPTTVARGVFGFGFSPDARWLYYRTACTREGEACDLFRIPAAGVAPGEKPERIAQAVKSFEFAPGRPDRVLLGFPRSDRVALDLALWESGTLHAVDTSAVPGTAQFAGADAGRLVYAVNAPGRRGIYVADVP